MPSVSQRTTSGKSDSSSSRASNAACDSFSAFCRFCFAARTAATSSSSTSSSSSLSSRFLKVLKSCSFTRAFRSFLQSAFESRNLFTFRSRALSTSMFFLTTWPSSSHRLRACNTRWRESISCRCHVSSPMAPCSTTDTGKRARASKSSCNRSSAVRAASACSRRCISAETASSVASGVRHGVCRSASWAAARAASVAAAAAAPEHWASQASKAANASTARYRAAGGAAVGSSQRASFRATCTQRRCEPPGGWCASQPASRVSPDGTTSAAWLPRRGASSAAQRAQSSTKRWSLCSSLSKLSALSRCSQSSAVCLAALPWASTSALVCDAGAPTTSAHWSCFIAAVRARQCSFLCRSRSNTIPLMSASALSASTPCRSRVAASRTALWRSASRERVSSTDFPSGPSSSWSGPRILGRSARALMHFRRHSRRAWKGRSTR
mmetsp:Transcript_102511/g.177024  ORF Transcript_102511/g.177024 Transcript_102511/m.177024 type:complete len:439 (+) Transcript_102511:562-1878(+)